MNLDAFRRSANFWKRSCCHTSADLVDEWQHQAACHGPCSLVAAEKLNFGGACRVCHTLIYLASLCPGPCTFLDACNHSTQYTGLPSERMPASLHQALSCGLEAVACEVKQNALCSYPHNVVLIQSQVPIRTRTILRQEVLVHSQFLSNEQLPLRGRN